MHRLQSTGFTDYLLEYLDVDGAIESEQARVEGHKADVESPKQEHGVTCSDSMAPSTSKYSSR
jgi:hypothetical protein